MIVYDEIASKNIASGYIDTYWFFENAEATSGEYTILPDCCMDIIFDFSTRSIFVCGVMTTARTVQINPRQKMFGIRFAPGILPAMVGIPAVRLQDAIVRLEDIDRELARALSGMFSIDGDKNNFADFCNSTFKNKLLAINQRVMLDLGELPINYSVKGLSRYLKTSVRQTERIFATYIGITPKRFLQIQRFLNVHQILQQSQSSLADISAAGGYFDQAHMHKEYQLLANNRPKITVMSSFYNPRSK